MLFRLVNTIDDVLVLSFLFLFLPNVEDRQAYCKFGSRKFLGLIGLGIDPREIYAEILEIGQAYAQQEKNDSKKNKRRKKKIKKKIPDSICITLSVGNTSPGFIDLPYKLKSLMIRVTLLRWALFLRGPIAWLFLSALSHCVRQLLCFIDSETVVSNNGSNASSSILTNQFNAPEEEQDFAKILALEPNQKYSHYHCKSVGDNRSFIYGPTGSTGLACRQ